jgi:predicted nucleic acid-binding protein
MGSYLIDSNIISKLVNQKLTNSGDKLVSENIDSGNTLISIIVYIELVSWKAPPQKDALNNLIQSAKILNIDLKIAQGAGILRQKHRMHLADAVIAATAIHHKLTLLTDNERDFANIKGLKLINPAKMV